jgi:hypothetical protein
LPGFRVAKWRRIEYVVMDFVIGRRDGEMGIAVVGIDKQIKLIDSWVLREFLGEGRDHPPDTREFVIGIA